MLSLQFASLHRNLLSSSSSSLLSSSKSRANHETDSHDREFNTFKSRTSQGRKRLSSVAAQAVENRDSQPSRQQYEIDQDKAREALAKLDKQLESLSKKQVPSPKIRGKNSDLFKETSIHFSIFSF